VKPLLPESHSVSQSANAPTPLLRFVVVQLVVGYKSTTHRSQWSLSRSRCLHVVCDKTKANKKGLNLISFVFIIPPSFFRNG